MVLNMEMDCNLHQQVEVQVYISGAIINFDQLYSVTLSEHLPEDDRRRALLAAMGKPAAG